MHLFGNISIRIKVLIAPVIMIAALAVILLIAIQGMESQRRVLSDVQEISLKRFQLVQEFVVTSEQVQSDVYRLSVLRFMQSPEPEIETVSERLNAGLNSLSVINGEILVKWSLDDTESALLQAISKSLHAFRHQVQQAVAAVSESPSFGILFVRSAAVPFSELSALLSRLLDYQNGKIAATRRHSDAMIGRNREIIILIAVVTALIALLITVTIGSNYISKPIISMARLMGRLTDGDLSVSPPGENRSDEIGQMEKALAVFRNTAIEKVRVDRKLQESEDRFRNLYNNAMVGLFRSRISDGKPLQINQQYAELAGFETVEQCLKDFVASAHYADATVRERMLDQIRRNGEIKGFEAEIIRNDNRSIWISSSARIYPKEGFIEGALVDITDRKKAERQLLASLQEKEILLREIHHRVKNNMQMIQSLINLQADKIKEPQLKAPLMESNNRIRVMALVHETLYRSDNLSEINLNLYFNQLAAQILSACKNPDMTVDLSVHIDSLALSIDKILACGLIVNELMTNSLKYAFAGKNHGAIAIRLNRTDADRALFSISDDGPGLPAGLDPTAVDSLGLHLVWMLSENQLDGNIAVSQANGLTYKIQFPL